MKRQQHTSMGHDARWYRGQTFIFDVSTPFLDIIPPYAVLGGELLYDPANQGTDRLVLRIPGGMVGVDLSTGNDAPRGNKLWINGPTPIPLRGVASIRGSSGGFGWSITYAELSCDWPLRARSTVRTPGEYVQAVASTTTPFAFGQVPDPAVLGPFDAPRFNWYLVLHDYGDGETALVMPRCPWFIG